MRLYPDVPRRRVAAVSYDLLLIVLLAALALVGLKVHDAVDQLAVLGEGVRKAGGAVPFGIGSPSRISGSVARTACTTSRTSSPLSRSGCRRS